ncbi:uncharacterized protein LOC124929017 [Impatiens glandulifera]|uniref:uncharacterized protein LOC124929017 n=1 Tax=Impatiens glandulifera TaxID=253017 RepID=UPI001FB18E82|nr:uncharacterized protein LOC124929017 [Impatiens glandulifera]
MVTYQSPQPSPGSSDWLFNQSPYVYSDWSSTNRRCQSWQWLEDFYRLRAIDNFPYSFSVLPTIHSSSTYSSNISSPSLCLPYFRNPSTSLYLTFFQPIHFSSSTHPINIIIFNRSSLVQQQIIFIINISLDLMEEEKTENEGIWIIWFWINLKMRKEKDPNQVTKATGQ